MTMPRDQTLVAERGSISFWLGETLTRSATETGRWR